MKWQIQWCCCSFNFVRSIGCVCFSLHHLTIAVGCSTNAEKSGMHVNNFFFSAWCSHALFNFVIGTYSRAAFSLWFASSSCRYSVRVMFFVHFIFLRSMPRNRKNVRNIIFCFGFCISEKKTEIEWKKEVEREKSDRWFICTSKSEKGAQPHTDNSDTVHHTPAYSLTQTKAAHVLMIKKNFIC